MKSSILTALSAALIGCGVTDWDLGSFPPDAAAPPPPITGDCGVMPSTLASIPNVLAQPMAIDSANVYVVATTPGDTLQTLWQVPVSGSRPRTIASLRGTIGGVDTDCGGWIFWTTTGEGDGGSSGAVWASNGPDTTPVLIAGDRPSPGAIIAEPLYWAEQTTDAEGHGVAAIVWSASRGGPVMTLQELDPSLLPRAFALPSEGPFELYWTTADPRLHNQSTAEIVGAPYPLPFGAAVTFAAADAGGVGGIQVITGPLGINLVYGGPTGIHTLSLDTPDATPHQVADTTGFVQTIAQSGNNFYFIDPGTRTLLTSTLAPDAGSPLPTALAMDVDPASALRADSACVYWVDSGPGSVKMVHQ